MTEPAAPLPRRDLDLAGLAQALFDERWVILTVLGASVVATLVGSLLQTPQFKGVALIQMKPRAGQEITTNEVVNNDQAGYMEARERARTQLQIILSRSIREEVVKQYHLLGFTDIADSPEGYDSLRGKMSAEPREDTQLVEIGVLHPDAARSAVLANLVADVYVRFNLSTRTDAARETQKWLDSQSRSSRTELDAATTKVMAFKEEHGLEDIDERVDDISTRMGALQTAMGAATAERVLLESTVASHRALLARDQFAVLAGMFDDPALETMLREQATLVTETADVLARYGEQHPEHQRAVEHIKRVKALIATEVRRNVDAEGARVVALKEQESQLAAELDQVKAELLVKQRLQSQYSELKGDEDRARKMFGSLGERGAEVDLQARSQLNDIRVIDRAIPPQKPSTPNIPLNVGMAFVVGLIGGVAGALVRRRLNETIDRPEDVERFLAAPLLGLVPTLPADGSSSQRALYAFNHPRSQPAEAIRGIRAVLQALPTRGAGRCYLVTSCLPGEGKTHTAVGIASAFAQLGNNVLLIDADLRIPRLHEVFGIPESPGMADALVDIDDPFRFVYRTSIPRLHLLRGGTKVEFPNEMLSSPELENLITKLCAAYQVVIIDTPPAGVVTDALALARQADGVILVVRKGRVPRDLAIKTLGQLRQLGARVLGVALNDMPRGKEYGAGYYDDHSRTNPAPTA